MCLEIRNNCHIKWRKIQSRVYIVIIFLLAASVLIHIISYILSDVSSLQIFKLHSDYDDSSKANPKIHLKNGWYIDYKYFQNIRISKRKISIKDKKKSVNHIKWINDQYIGYCRHFLHTFVAFPYLTQSGTEENLLFNTSINMFNTSILWGNMTRVKYFQSKKATSRWRFASVTVIYDPFPNHKHDRKNQKSDDDFSYIYKNKSNAIFTINKYSMLIEIIIVGNSDLSQKGDYQGEFFLCVFNDGNVVLSNRLTQHNSFMFVIQCDISNRKSLIDKILDDSVGIDDDNYNDQVTTNVGLTVFSLKTIHDWDKHTMKRQFQISKRIQMPVCGKIVVNQKPKIYDSEIEYYRDFKTNENYNHELNIHSTLHYISTKNDYIDDSTSSNLECYNITPKYFLSALTGMCVSVYC